MNKKYSKTGIKRLFSAYVNSYKGIKHLLKTEAAFIQEFWLVILLLPVIFYVEVSMVEKLLLFSSLMLVLIMEVVNTAIEAAIDRISEEFHPLSGLAKDLGSLAVLMSLLLVLVTWLTILVF